MSSLLIFLVGVLPAVALVLYIYLLDKNQREPLPWIFRATLYGVLSGLASILIEGWLSQANIQEGTLDSAFYNSFVVAALTEEGMKLFFLWLLLRKNPYFDERMDCIVYAACVSMGFAALENVGYVVRAEEAMEVALHRAIFSVPAHFFFGVFMGYFMSLAIWGKPEKRLRNWILTLLVPIILHGTYDACLFSMPLSDGILAVSLFIFILLGIYVWIGGHRHIVRTLARDKKHMVGSPNRQEGFYNKEERSDKTINPMGPVEPTPSVPVKESRVSVESFHVSEPTPHVSESTSPTGKRLFQSPFSFEGRIRRKEFCYSYLIFLIWYQIVLSKDSGSSDFDMSSDWFLLVTFIPMLWFNFAQSCKRCHDIGRSGWWQIIPFFSLWLMLAVGDSGTNEYGDSPK